MTSSPYPMPPSMMGGAPPEGDNRLHLELTLRNDGRQARIFEPNDLSLRSDAGEVWSPQLDSFPPSRLLPGEFVSLDVYFDVPEATQLNGLALSWLIQGQEQRLAVAGDPHESIHGP